LGGQQLDELPGRRDETQGPAFNSKPEASCVSHRAEHARGVISEGCRVQDTNGAPSNVFKAAKRIHNEPKMAAVKANCRRVHREIAPAKVFRYRRSSHDRQLRWPRVSFATCSDQIHS
jgi:hypothetical protein